MLSKTLVETTASNTIRADSFFIGSRGASVRENLCVNRFDYLIMMVKWAQQQFRESGGFVERTVLSGESHDLKMEVKK